MNSITQMRKNYQLKTLSENNVKSDPIAQFKQWFDEARACDLPEPNAMTIATATKDGIPSARTVLLKAFNEIGFIFYTNYESRKGKELLENPRAALLFHWHALERQVRIEGIVNKITAIESDEYFQSRPKESQIGACVSKQSEIINSRLDLEEKEKNFIENLGDRKVARPPHWGGYLVKPRAIEFWQGRPSRLHDRIQYILNNKDQDKNKVPMWNIFRLAP